MLKCPICGEGFDENVENAYDIFATHVQKCCTEQSLKKKTEDMRVINDKLQELKRAKSYYEELDKEFREKYPKMYKVNFPEMFTETTVKREEYFNDEDELTDAEKCMDCTCGDECKHCHDCAENDDKITLDELLNTLDSTFGLKFRPL